MAFHIEQTGRGYCIYNGSGRLVAEDVDCYQDALWRVEELEDADLEEAEADPAIDTAPAYVISRAYKDEVFLIVRDLGGIVATVSYDHHAGQWAIAASTERYSTHADLPAVFGGHFHNYAETFGDVFRFFGCPLPGAAAIATAKETAA